MNFWEFLGANMGWVFLFTIYIIILVVAVVVETIFK